MSTQPRTVFRGMLSGLMALLTLAAFSIPSAAQAKLRVAATLPDLAALAREVGGDSVEVTSLSAANQDPHYVDPRPNLIVALSRADLLVLNGLELEVGWLPPLLTNSRNARILPGTDGYLDASEYVQTIGEASVIDRAMGDIHPGGNPHFTYDPRAAVRILRAIAERMGATDPENADVYKRNAARAVAELQALVDAEAKRFRSLPDVKRGVVCYHESFPYLLDWLGLTQVETIEPKPGIPPTPGHVALVLKTMRAKKTRVIFQQDFYPKKTSERLAALADGVVVVIDGGTRFAGGQRYIDHIRSITGGLYDALAR